MVVAGPDLFSQFSTFSRHTAQGVVQALLASEESSGSNHNPGVVAVEDMGGASSGPPQRDKGGAPKFHIGACLQEQELLRC